jgi:predicted ATPase
VRGQTQPALELAQQLLQRVERQTDTGPEMLGHYLLGMALFQRGALKDAVQHFEEAVSRYDRHQHHQLAHLYGIDIGVAARSFLSWPLWYLGYPERALEHGRQALTLAQELGHPFSLVFAHCWLAWLHQLRQEPQAAQEQGEAGAALASQQRFALYAAWSTVAHGWALTQLDQSIAGTAKMQEGLGGAAITGAEALRPYFLALLAEAKGNSGPEEGLQLVDEALKVVEHTEERFYEAELYRLKGTLTLKQSEVRGPASGVPNTQHPTPNSHAEAEAEACFYKAIEIAQQQQAKSLELRAAMSLGRLWQQQGKKEEARQLLAEIYGWFTEGFDTKDLQEAKALLKELDRPL